MSKILITESKLNDAIKNSINKFINESILLEFTNNLSAREFKSDMIKLGFKKDPDIGKGSDSQSWFIPEYGDKYRVTVHLHGDKGTQVKADSLRHVRNTLLAMGWFNIPGNIDKFPFKKWGTSKKSIITDYGEEYAINKANEEYANANVTPVYPSIKNTVYLIKDETKGYNLCKSSNDRRPLLDTWFEDFDTSMGKPSFLNFNYGSKQIEALPINPDGSLADAIIIERKTRKNKIL